MKILAFAASLRKDWLNGELIRHSLTWVGVAAVIACVAGSASALFLLALDWVTDWRESHLWIVALLPVGGFIMGWIYHRFGRAVEAGNNLILDEIHDPRAVVPARMAPLVLFGTLATHFFGGSAGREGTAVQMGASLADQLGRPMKLTQDQRRIFLMAGMSAGFASVFGTPLAGAVFGFEVLSVGTLNYEAILPCFVAAVGAHEVALAWGIHHTSYRELVGRVPELAPLGVLTALLAGAVFGIMGMIFARTTHAVSRLTRVRIAYAPLRPALGGVLVALAVWALGTSRYIGLGVPTIVESFKESLPPWDFVIKTVFTAITLGSGFKGGEVTPLFFIGAALGNALGIFLPLPQPLLAGMGLVAVFAGAANVPVASTLMAVELFGPEAGVYAGLACVVAYIFSGHGGIYRSQKTGLTKFGVKASRL